MTDRVGLARVYIVWPTPRHFTPEDAALDVLGHVLAGGKTSRLYRALVREKQIAQDVQAYQDGQELTSEFAVVATVRPGHTIAEVEAAIAEEIDRIKAEPPTAEEMERAVNTFEARLVRSLESVSEFGGRADRLNLYNTYTGDPGYMAKDFGRYGRVDAAKVTADGQAIPGSGPRGRRGRARERGFDSSPIRWFQPTRPARGWPRSSPRPLGEGQGVRVPCRLSRRRLPRKGPAASRCRKAPPNRNSACRPSKRATLSNGMQLLLVEKHELPVVNLHVVFPAGRASDGQQRAGACGNDGRGLG